ncbi:hypothetical protein LCGC14_0708050 [marine sediment metagenome]|uniref:Uncharacterized protein n=1 Tax=marine sediment metagenome TaxID=412755 RepID=A0A0F9QFU8_9ZZZZ
MKTPEQIQARIDELNTARQNGGLMSSQEAELINLKRLQE